MAQYTFRYQDGHIVQDLPDLDAAREFAVQMAVRLMLPGETRVTILEDDRPKLAIVMSAGP